MLATLGLAVVLLGALEPSGEGLLARQGFVVEDTPRRLLLLPAAEGGASEAHGSVSEDARSERSQQALRLHRTLKLVTTGSLLVTGALGTLAAINEGTVFESGRCDTGNNPIFGDYGCESLHLVHGASAILSSTLYTATAVQGLYIGPPSLAQMHGPLYRILSYVHLVGMVLQPVLGILAAYPEVIGIHPGNREHFGEVVRTAHIGIGYVTIAAYVTTTVFEF